jgi:hypothetical protein
MPRLAGLTDLLNSSECGFTHYPMGNTKRNEKHAAANRSLELDTCPAAALVASMAGTALTADNAACIGGAGPCVGGRAVAGGPDAKTGH